MTSRLQPYTMLDRIGSESYQHTSPALLKEYGEVRPQTMLNRPAHLTDLLAKTHRIHKPATVHSNKHNSIDQSRVFQQTSYHPSSHPPQPQTWQMTYRKTYRMCMPSHATYHPWTGPRTVPYTKNYRRCVRSVGRTPSQLTHCIRIIGPRRLCYSRESSRGSLPARQA